MKSLRASSFAGSFTLSSPTALTRHRRSSAGSTTFPACRLIIRSACLHMPPASRQGKPAHDDPSPMAGAPTELQGQVGCCTPLHPGKSRFCSRPPRLVFCPRAKHSAPPLR